MTITEFLEARIAQDEAALERTSWYPHSTHGQDAIGTYRADCPDCLGVPSPARALAECAAKRAIVALHPVTMQLWWDEQCEIDVCATCQEDSYPDSWPCPTIRIIAAVYASHPDYRQEWAL